MDLLKLVTDSLSRHIARVTVHFGAVTDKFTPSTVFEIQNAKELKDITLSAACSLHTASGSTSSSTSSLRQRRLIEIEEEEGEIKRQSVVVEEHSPDSTTASIDTPFDEAHDDNDHHASHADIPELLKVDTYRSPGSDPIADPNHDPEPLSLVPTISVDPVGRPSTEYEPLHKSTNQERTSFAESTRSEHSTYISYTSGRQKVKLGPRPSIDTPVQGPSGTARPVSSLPAGLKLISRNSQKNKNRLPPSNKTLLSPTMEGVVSPSEDALGKPVSAERPNSSSGASLKSTLSTCTMTSRTSNATASSDQTKLMKALEMRKKKMAMSANAQTQTDPDPSLIPLPVDKNEKIDVPNGNSNAAESDGTVQSSTPASPSGPAAPSTEFTKASSLSDTTNETVREVDGSKIVQEVKKAEGEPSTSAEAITSADSQEHSQGKSDTPLANNSENVTPAKVNGIGEDPSETTALPAIAAVVVEPVKTVVNAASEIIKPQTSEASEEAADSKPETTQTSPLSAGKPELQINGESSDEVNLLHAPPGPQPVVEAYPPALDKAANSSTNGAAAASDADLDVEDEDFETPKKELKMPVSKFAVDKESEQLTLNGAEASEPKASRRSLIKPIITDSELVRRPVSDFINDEDLMDELQSATVQEAKPISLPKSPGRAMFSPDITKSEAGDRVSRAVSNPHQLLNAQQQPQRPEPARSASASWLNRSSQPQPSPLVKKVNLGGGIASRIKALEKLSTTAGGAGGPTSQPGSAVSPGPSPAFFGVGRKLNGSSAQSIAERANSLTRRPPSAASIRGGVDSSPEQQFMGRGRTLSTTSRKENSSSPMGLNGRSRPESRPYSAKSLANQASENLSPTYSRSSPSVTEEQKQLVADIHKASQERLASPAKGRRTSITAVKDLLSGSRTSMSERRRSTALDPVTNLSRSDSRPDLTHNDSSHSVTSHRSSQDYGARSPSVMSDENSEKKASRASRMLHRISSSVSASKKSITHAISPTVREEAEPPSSPAKLPEGEASTVLEMGDVNVQFPDNLLWKRRAMHLDSHGYLILTQSPTGTDRNAGAKKYHLQEFTRPAIPDIDMEEMPNSVVLSFVKGSGVQFACADRQGQMWVLKRKSHPILNVGRR